MEFQEKELKIINLTEEEQEYYFESKSQIFQYREQTQSQLDSMLKWKKDTEDEIKLCEFLIAKAQFDESYNIYLEKLEKRLKTFTKKLEEAVEPIEKVTKIVADFDYIIDKYFTEEPVEDGFVVNPTTVEYLKISSKIVILG